MGDVRLIMNIRQVFYLLDLLDIHNVVIWANKCSTIIESDRDHFVIFTLIQR